MSDESENDESGAPSPSPDVETPDEGDPTTDGPTEEEEAPGTPATPEPADEPTIEPPAPPVLPEFGVEVFARLSKDEILDALESLTVSELTDLRRRWKIVFALNGISPEFRAMTATERLELVDVIIKSQDEATT